MTDTPDSPAIAPSPSVPLWSLREAAGFLAVRNAGVSVRETPFVVSVLKVDDGLPPRLGLAISKNVGNAVMRNTLRRRVKVIVRAEATALVGYLVTVRALPEAATTPSALSRGALVSGLRRALARSNASRNSADPQGAS